MPANSKSHRLRLGRYSESNRLYLLTTTTQHRQPIFTDFNLARLLIAELRAASNDGWVTSFAWVVMPDHFHWLIELHNHPLHILMRRVKSNSSRSINQKTGRTGALWQSGFHDRAIRQDEDIRVAARYIIANPLRAGLVTRIGNYPLWDACWL